MRRPRTLTERERLHLYLYVSGSMTANEIKLFLNNANLKRFRKYNNYIRWARKQLKAQDKKRAERWKRMSVPQILQDVNSALERAAAKGATFQHLYGTPEKTA